MNEQQAKEEVNRRIEVSSQKVRIAKGFVLSNFNKSSKKMLTRFLEHVQAQRPEKVVLHESVDPENQLSQAANVISWQLAFAEALWALIGGGLVMPTTNNLHEIDFHQDWTAVVPGDSGQSSAWSFDEHRAILPEQVRLAPSLQGKSPQPFTEPDLLLKDINIPDIDPGVEEALRLAVECFRHELYLPCVAMLGLASEGAWLEMGRSILKANPKAPGLTQATRDKAMEELKNPHVSILKKMERILEIYKRQDVFSEVANRSGFKPDVLNQVFIWSNVIRDSRNAIHYGADPATENTYEKVATLLLGTGLNLRILYSIQRAAEELS